jgi:hypothetical protein
VTGGAGGFIEMDAQPIGGFLDFLESRDRFKELFLGKQAVLRIETLRRLLWPDVCRESREKHNLQR